MMRLMGLDYGDARIGVAVSDALGWTARGHCTIARKNPTDLKSSIEEIGKILQEYSITKIIIGYPKNMDNTEGENCKKVAKFAEKLQVMHPAVSIELFDERLSTAMAQKIFNNQNTKVKKGQKGALDMLAAEIILQGYLDKNARENKENN